ncbi:MAG: oligosaccharide flippase family protein [Anaerolineales bacterium]
MYRLQYRPWPYIGLTLGNSLITALSTIALVAWLDWGINGYFVGNAVGSLVAALIGWWSIRSYLDLSIWHRDWWPKLVKFGTPFVPVALGMYILNTADRWFIIRYSGQTALGVYAVADKFAVLLVLLVTTFRQAWWPIAMDAVHSSDGPALLRMMGRLYLGVSWIGVVLLTAVSPWLVRYLTTPAYYDAYILVGILALQPLNYGFQMIVSIGAWKAEKTVWSPVSLGVAAILNIALAYWLVPLYGGMGAAIATAVAYFVWTSLTIVVSERFWPVKYPVGVFGIQTLLGISLVIAILVLGASQDIWQMALVTLAGVLVLGGVTVKRSQVEWVMREFRKRRSISAGES